MMRSPRGLALVLFVLALGAATAARAKEWPVPDTARKVGVSASFSPARIEPGAQTTLEVRVAMSPGWHIYSFAETQSFPTKLDPLRVPEAWQLSDWKEPAPHPLRMPGFESPLMSHEGHVVFQRKVTLPDDFPPGEYPVEGELHFTVCDDKSCLPPDMLPYAATLTVAGTEGAGGDEPAGEKASGGSGSGVPPIPVDPSKQWGAAASVDPATVKPGAEAVLRVHVRSAPGWHVYALRADDPNVFTTKISVPELPEGFELDPDSEWSGPDPFPFAMPGLPPAPVHEGTVLFTRPLHVSEDVAKGEYTIRGEVQAMACDHERCLTPGGTSIETSIAVDPESGAAAPSVRYTETRGSDTIGTGKGASAAAAGGLWKLLLAAIGGAMISWIMPCVYPMIPITLSFFGKVAEEKHAKKVGVATAYGIGIAGTFILLGLVVGLLTMLVSDTSARSGFASLGNVIATNPWINLVIGIVFVLFALSMFGMFTIQVPSWLISRTDSAGRASGSAYIGAVLLGITFALASFTCTVPVVGLLLGLAASGTAGGVASSLVGMVVYGVVFAAPFVLLSLFPTALSALPRAGSWMETVKIGFGFLEIAVAIKFLWVPDLEWGIGILSRPVVLALFALIGLAAAAYFLGILKIGHTNPRAFRVGPGRIVAALVTLLVVVPVGLSLAKPPAYQSRALPGWVSVGLEVVLPPAPAGDELARLEGWYVDEYDAAVAEAKKKGMPVFIDFTGVYCGNCRAMENSVFPLEPVAERLEQMVRTRLYVDRPEERHKRFARMQVERYGVASQPYYVILDPQNDEESLAEAGGYIGKSRFLEFLDEGLAGFAARRNEVASSE